MGLLSRASACLPRGWRYNLRRFWYTSRWKRGRFRSPEPEFARLGEWVSSGDCVLDVGANVGEYTAELSRHVWPKGRVFAMEPFPETFALLADLCRRLSNVTALNLAASDTAGVVRMQLPGVCHAEARIGTEGVPVWGCPVDSLPLPPIRLVKLDVEGHELAALCGMARLLERDRPVLIVEARQGTAEILSPLGYQASRLPGSPNMLFFPLATSEKTAGCRILPQIPHPYPESGQTA